MITEINRVLFTTPSDDKAEQNVSFEAEHYRYVKEGKLALC